MDRIEQEKVDHIGEHLERRREPRERGVVSRDRIAVKGADKQRLVEQELQVGPQHPFEPVGVLGLAGGEVSDHLLDVGAIQNLAPHL